MSVRLKSHVFHICTQQPTHDGDDGDVDNDDDDTYPVPCRRVWSSQRCGLRGSARFPQILRSHP